MENLYQNQKAITEVAAHLELTLRVEADESMETEDFELYKT